MSSSARSWVSARPHLVTPCGALPAALSGGVPRGSANPAALFIIVWVTGLTEVSQEPLKFLLVPPLPVLHAAWNPAAPLPASRMILLSRREVPTPSTLGKLLAGAQVRPFLVCLLGQLSLQGLTIILFSPS